MSQYVEASNGITVTTQCYACIQIERYCDEHADLQEARDTANAYAIVDDGNMQYHRTWSWLQDEPSNHDWIGSLVRTPKGEREEFAPQTTLLTDRMFDEAMLELQPNEAICDTCHYATNRYAVCPNCN
jgi:acetone carboxylase gamma subunit